MSTTKTAAILERVPAILAVTANSYGLNWRAGSTRRPEAHGDRRRNGRNKAGESDKPAAPR